MLNINLEKPCIREKYLCDSVYLALKEISIGVLFLFLRFPRSLSECSRLFCDKIRPQLYESRLLRKRHPSQIKILECVGASI